MNGENSDLQKHFIELAQRHSLSLGEPALPAEFTRKLRCEYVASCIRDGMDIPSAVSEGLRMFAGPLDSNSGFDDILHNAFDAIARVGAKPDARIFVGFLNTGLHNASIRKTEHGYLIFINRGLLQCVYQSAKIMHLGMNLAKYDSRGRYIPGSEFASAGWNYRRCTKALAELCIVYWEGFDPAKAPRYDILSGERLRSLHHWVSAAEEFVICHEIAHVLAGDLDDAGKTQSRISDPSLDPVNFSHEIEYRADLYGLRLFLSNATWSNASGVGDAQFRFAGPTMFFCISDLLEQVGLKFYPRLCASKLSHPPTRERLNRILGHLRSRYSYPRLYEQSNYCKEYFEKMTEVVIDRIEEQRTGKKSGLYYTSPILTPYGESFGSRTIRMRYA